MKFKVYPVVVCLAFILAGFVSQTDALMEEAILEFLEEIRHRMCYPLFGLPALDPYQIEHADFEMDNKYIVDLVGSVTDLRVTGLSDFNVTDIKISTIPMRKSNFNIVLPLTALKSLYKAKGSLAYIVYIDGNGNAIAHIDNVKLSISWVLKTGLTMGIRNLNIELSIGDLFIDIENLMEEQRITDFLHALINEMGIELLNDVWVEAQDRGIVKYVEDTINKFLGNYTLSDIIKIIGGIGGGGGEEPPFGGVPADCKTKNLI
ncbi:uncharacterized protein LOC119600556 [Lucilia sericata]|uniref:uncharacterized protein LOC119600556 n=1 Tax=Lucilia sericata TaxID=13632 RepID=UPI0018A81ED9|nr:uncharacterized protein LOC119600556 [Lucilia sericata]